MISLSVYTSEPLNFMALEFLFQSCEDINLLPPVSGFPSLLQQVFSQKPDVLLLAMNADLDQELLKLLRRESPDVKLVLWVHDINPEQAYQAMDLGVSGILRKVLPPEMILKCVRKVHAGERWFERTLTEGFFNRRQIKLSKREGELLTLVAQGLKNKEIAQAMWITEGTVKVYLSRLFEKVGARDRVELVLIGLRNWYTKVEPGGSAKDRAVSVQKVQRRSARSIFSRSAAS